jgi:integrase
MPRPRKTIPAYRHHAPRNSGKVVVAGDVIYFPGKYNSAESLAAYRAWLTHFLATGQVRTPLESKEATVGEVILGFLEQVVIPRFSQNGKFGGEGRSYQIALRPVARLCDSCPTSEFTPKMLKQCRQDLVNAGYTRRRINQHVQRIRRCFKWGVAEGMVPATIWQALEAVEGLRYGEAKAEAKKVEAVPEDRVATLEPFLTPPVWAMIQLQLWTGARPGEICQMRTRDIQADDPKLPPEVRGLCWVYRPESHKTEHHGKDRIILLGPQARAVVEPWLRPAEPEAYLFSPAEARRWWEQKRRAEGKTHRKKLTRKPCPKVAPKDHYDVPSYRHAITRACAQAFGMPSELRKIPRSAPDAEKQALRKKAAEWRKVHCWHPHQLRHTAATKIRREYGIEVARIILGHSNIATTEIYAEIDLVKAAQAMSRLG